MPTRPSAALDFGEWWGAYATRKNDDGTVSLVLLTPRLLGWSFVARGDAGHRTLVLRGGQQEYVFDEVK
jgi:hypothetical protein